MLLKGLFLILIFCKLVSCLFEITDSSYNDMLKKHKYILIEFYEKWCTNCYKGQLETLSKQLKTLIPGAEIATGRIEMVQNPLSTKQLASKSMPILRFYKDG